ncbi:homocysteine methyltransferase [Roseovarius atlanticus]|uniref:Homocysteine methyltransferase n=1 Tax=Roseovarius atlanticus TaxID=1641875 RepID=A0A0T5NYB3_9RHOB|nr:homocysteine S-methyltransferase family protein [Roseovarius atlanticus]KRS13901.1 homocysteine methyltransferase [Roseovarius atlanticus]
MAQVTLLDGSIGQELVKRSGDRATPLWSTQVMIDHPKLVGEVHLDYFNVGATVATTNTYAVLRDRLVRIGLEDKVGQLTDTAVRAARRARAASGGKGRVAGAIGPLVQSYKPETCPPAAEAAKMYAEPVGLMKDHVDLFLLETMSSVDQAEGALRAVAGQGLPVWLAVSVDDHDGTRLRSGEPVADLAQTVAKHLPDAVLVNCSRPEAIGAALEVIKGFGVPFGAYGNGFAEISEGFLGDAPTVDALEQRKDMGPLDYAEYVMGWVGQGATIVGGCCEIGPAHIAEIARCLQAAGHEIV